MLVALGFVLGWQVTLNDWWTDSAGSGLVEKNSLNAQKDVNLELFWLVWDEVEKKYVDLDKVDKQKMVYGAIKGMVGAIDDAYTVFMDPEETKQFSDSLEGKLEGIGAELTVEEGKLVIVTPLRESPAEKAGLLPKDVVDKIDGVSAAELTLFEAIMKIRGTKGTTVTLSIIREGVDDPFEVSIVRDSIDIESVTVEKLDGEITYIAVNQFNDRTEDEFRKAISELILDQPKGMIIDLRFNGGGYLDIAVEMLSHLLPAHAPVVIIRERGKEDEIIETNGNSKVLDIPLVVLVNDSSASASEIVAGAIQDHERGVVMGVKTFGKGSVQEVEAFTDGSSLRMTIAKWFTPDGRGIDKVGLMPDIVVEITDEDIENEYDRQKEEAIKYLKERN